MAAPRRMRIKAMINTPRRGRAGFGDDEGQPLKSPGSPFVHDVNFTPAFSPAPKLNTEEESPDCQINDSNPKTNSSSRNKKFTTAPTARVRRKSKVSLSDSDMSELEEVNFANLTSPRNQKTSPSPPPPSHTNPTNASRPGPAHSPFKTIAMMTPGNPPKSPQPPSALSQKKQIPIHAPVPSRSHLPISPQFQSRKTPSPNFGPKSPGPVTVEFSNRPSGRPTSPLKSPSHISRGHVFSPPSGPSSPFLSLTEREHNWEESRRAYSPAISNNLVSGGMSGNMNSINSSETLRQRLQKGTNLNTSKYATMRREFMLKYGDKKPDTKELTILHYTFWNPPSENKDDESKNNVDDEDDIFSNNTQESDNPSSPSTRQQKLRKTNFKNEPEDKTAEAEKTLPIGPRVKVGPNGELILDEQSLVVETSESQRAKKHLEEIETVSGANYEVGSSGFYRHKRNLKRGGDWTQRETVKFYRGLSMCGTDFSMMTHLFPNRSRAELKAKFKREDRKNPGQISQALACQTFDPMDKITSSEEEEEEDTPPKRRRKRYAQQKKKEIEDQTDKLEKTCQKAEPGKLVEPSKEKSNDQGSEDKKAKDLSMPDLKRFDKSIDIKKEKEAGTSKQGHIDSKDLALGNVNTQSKESQNKIHESPPKTTQPVPPLVYDNRSKPNLKKGRPTKLVHFEASDLTKPKDAVAPAKRGRKPSKQAIKAEVTKRVTKKKRLTKKAGNVSSSEQEPATTSTTETSTNSESIFARSEMLRFDPTDPLGFNVIQSVPQNLADGGTEVILDAPNRDSIPHQVFEIGSTSTSANNSSNQSQETTLVSSADGITGQKKPRSARIKPKPRPPGYRVPGSGDKVNSQSSIMVDEIEIEITCV